MHKPLHIFGPFQNRALSLDDGCLVYLECPNQAMQPWQPQPYIPQCALDELASIGGLAGLRGIAGGKVSVMPRRASRPNQGLADGGNAA